MALFAAPRRGEDGQHTQRIYGLIRDQHFTTAIEQLQEELQGRPDSRAALSLLGYCYYQTGQFEDAAQMYEHLVRLNPDNEDYKLYFSQCLYKAGQYEDACRTITRVTSQELSKQVSLLLIAAAYEQEDLASCRRHLAAAGEADHDFIADAGCVMFKENDYAGALAKFTEAAAALGQLPELQYNMALCKYKLKDYSGAMKHLADIIEAGERDHPELHVGSALDGKDVRSVGNSQVLKDAALVEAFNLKAAIEYGFKETDKAKADLASLPPRREEELDPVTLHNSALVNMDSDPGAGFKKLNFLISSGTFPRETFGNLLLLYCAPAHQFYDLAADVMAENPAYCQELLSKELRGFLEAAVLRGSQPDEALRRLDQLAGRHTEVLRALTKRIQDARSSWDQGAVRGAIQQYDDALDAYIPVLMAMASIFWDREAYSAVDRLFKQSAEFCSEHATWKLNLAHTYFMQEKFTEAIKYYQPVVAQNADSLLGVTAMVLANLCVAYIMNSQNEEAEELMRAVEREEEGVVARDPQKLTLHLCIINMVIGTLYCSKGNYEFGISRIIKSLEPYDTKLGTDTWFYAKRCLLSLADGLAKHMITFKETSWEEVFTFLGEAERYGRDLPAAYGGAGAAAAGQRAAAGGGGGAAAAAAAADRTVAAEARMIKRVLLRLRDE